MITLDINSSGIRIIEAENGKIVSWAGCPLEPGIFRDGILEDTQSLAKAIRELVASIGIKGKKVTVGISGLYSLNRILVIPLPPGGHLSTAGVMKHAEEILPFSEEAVYFSWTIIGPVEGGHQVLVHAVPRESIDDTLKVLKTAGLSSNSIDLTPMALARAVNTDEGLILNIENESYDVIVVIDGLPEVIRTSAWKPEGMSLEEKAEYLVSAVETTVSFCNTSRPGFTFGKTNPLFITGEMSGDTTLVNNIREFMGYTEGIFNIPYEYPEAFPVSRYAAEAGLAMKEMKPEEKISSGYLSPEINLLPDRYKPWKPSPKQIYISLAFILAVVFIFPVYQAAIDTMDEIENVQNQYNALNSLLELRKAEITKRDPLRQTVDEYTIITNMGSGFVEDYETITGITEKLNVAITPITHSGNTISFSCQTESYQVFRDFIAALEGSSRFLSPIIPPEGYPYIKSGIIQLQINPNRT